MAKRKSRAKVKTEGKPEESNGAAPDEQPKVAKAQGSKMKFKAPAGSGGISANGSQYKPDKDGMFTAHSSEAAALLNAGCQHVI